MDHADDDPPDGTAAPPISVPTASMPADAPLQVDNDFAALRLRTLLPAALRRGNRYDHDQVSLREARLVAAQAEDAAAIPAQHATRGPTPVWIRVFRLAG